ncbi:hypothetical protein BX616_002373 [Lobosporangium transversale]|nr:hypothetical protein BX616_002373 [Lobosporangium transversale]
MQRQSCISKCTFQTLSNFDDRCCVNVPMCAEALINPSARTANFGSLAPIPEAIEIEIEIPTLWGPEKPKKTRTPVEPTETTGTKPRKTQTITATPTGRSVLPLPPYNTQSTNTPTIATITVPAFPSLPTVVITTSPDSLSSDILQPSITNILTSAPFTTTGLDTAPTLIPNVTTSAAFPSVSDGKVWAPRTTNSQSPADVLSSISLTISLDPKPTEKSTTITVTTTALTMITTTTITAVQPSTTSHYTRRTKTTTPWLPSTIVPVVPTQTIPIPSPGTSLPEVVIPDLHPDIPPNSIKVQLRLEHVSYAQVINNGVLAAQLVSFIPAQLGEVLSVDPGLILVLAIRDGSIEGQGTLKKMRKRALVTTKNVEDAILVTVAIPRAQYWTLSELVKDKNSTLYTPDGDTFGQYLDPTFPLSSRPPPKGNGGDKNGGDSGGDGGNGNGKNRGDDEDSGSSADPLTGALPGSVVNDSSNGSDNKRPANKGPLIGSIVGLVALAYVAIAVVVVRKYRKKKQRQIEREALQRSISSPIEMQGSSNGWGGWYR